jgi:hypothetical protein
VAAVSGTEVGWLAALDDGRLVARYGAGPPNAGSAIVRAAAFATGTARPCLTAEGESALAEARQWLASEQLARDCGIVVHALPLHEALRRHTAASLRDVPRHERTAALALAGRLRDALRQAPSLGAERELEGLLAAHARGDLTGVEWLQLSCNVATRRAALASPRDAEVVAIIVFGSGDAAQCSDQRAMRPLGPTAQPVSSLENATLL